MGAVYLTRARNEHAKAGNMNNGLKHAKGDIVVVFDADHAPFRAFLRETVGHFAARSQAVSRADAARLPQPRPDREQPRTFDRMPSENEMFYSITQRGLDKWNGSFFCGSAALLRRTALETTGGFSGITITEDCETAFELHSQGLDQRLCRQAADRRPAARNVRVLHRPALALVPGHVPDPDAEESGSSRRA